MRETWVQSLGWEDPLEEDMATHFSILAWRIPWTEESSGLQSMGSQSDTTERLNTQRTATDEEHRLIEAQDLRHELVSSTAVLPSALTLLLACV